MDTKQHINLIESIKKVGEHDPMKILPYTQAQWEQHKKNQEAKDKEDKEDKPNVPDEKKVKSTSHHTGRLTDSVEHLDEIDRTELKNRLGAAVARVTHGDKKHTPKTNKQAKLLRKLEREEKEETQAKERESRDKAVEVLLKSKLGDKNTSITKTPRPQINIRTGERTNSGAEDEANEARDPNLLAKHWKKIHAARAREAQEKKDAEERSAKENQSSQYNSNEIRDRVKRLRQQEFDTGSFEESVELEESYNERGLLKKGLTHAVYSKGPSGQIHFTTRRKKTADFKAKMYTDAIQFNQRDHPGFGIKIVPHGTPNGKSVHKDHKKYYGNP